VAPDPVEIRILLDPSCDMSDPRATLAWIVELLTSRGIPFQAVGGLAARAYGATRRLVDLDFYLPMRRYPEIEADLVPYLTRPPRHHRDDAWDITFAQLAYAGQTIELGGIEGARYYDRVGGCWVPQRIDFARSEWIDLFGVWVPVMPRDELVTYKQRLDRLVDRWDLAEIAARGPA
jgi:hypothetical protein